MGSSQAPAETAHQEPVKACVQCGTTKTPQWREGPAGPRTLCNACGVKLKRHEKAQAEGRRKSDASQHAQVSHWLSSSTWQPAYCRRTAARWC
eukprot:jgi/Astpho2/9561/e_gw1.00146.192.1_t